MVFREINGCLLWESSKAHKYAARTKAELLQFLSKLVTSDDWKTRALRCPNHKEPGRSGDVVGIIRLTVNADSREYSWWLSVETWGMRFCSAVKIHTVIFWVMRVCSSVPGRRRREATRRLRFQGRVRGHVWQKRENVTTRLHGVIIQKGTTWLWKFLTVD
jgi:hypothetical protein